MNEKAIGQVLKSYRVASKAAKAFRVAHTVALGYAAAALVVGGVKIVKKMRGEE